MISDQKILEQYKLSIERDIKELLQEKIGSVASANGDRAEVLLLLCARYFSPPLRQMRSPLHTNFFAAFCHPPC
jgi:hypothetical protein